MSQAQSRKTQTDKRPYKSHCSDGYVTAGEYITELMYQKWAIREDLGQLPQFFWRLDQHKKRHKSELVRAHKLLKMYSATAIINAINSYQAKWLISLYSKKLEPIIKQEQQKVIEREFVPTEVKEVRDGATAPSLGKKNPLRDL